MSNPYVFATEWAWMMRELIRAASAYEMSTRVKTTQRRGIATDLALSPKIATR